MDKKIAQAAILTRLALCYTQLDDFDTPLVDIRENLQSCIGILSIAWFDGEAAQLNALVPTMENEAKFSFFWMNVLMALKLDL